MPVENKGFGALFAEKKNSLDHLQAKMASVLPAFPGMPVAKYFDLAIGIDFHESVFPPLPLLPVPHLGMVFDIMSAIMSAVASVVPPPPAPPEPAEGEEAPSQPVTMAGIAQMLVHAMKPSVKVHGQWVANAGTGIQHLPGIFVHLPFPIVKPMASSEMFMGSSTVLADGGPCSTQFHPALSCNLVGIPAPFRITKPKPKIALMAPTSVLVVITSGGPPVLVGGPPTIDLFQLMFKMALKGITKAVGKGVKKAAAKVNSKFPKLGKTLKAIKCHVFGEPVDAVTGRVYSANIDFELPGPIPLVWERTYYSDAAVPGPLGYSWHHSFHIGMCDLENGYFSIRLPDGRETVMPALGLHEKYFNRDEQLWWGKDKQGYYLVNSQHHEHRFADTPDNEGYCLVSSISDKAGFRILFRYNRKGHLQQITDSSHRKLSVDTDEAGRILGIHAPHNGAMLPLIRYAYDEDGNLCRVTDAMDVSKHFYYKGHLLVTLTNQSGVSFYWEYDGKGEDARCAHTWGDGGILEYHTRYEDGKTVTTNGEGHTTEYYYDERNLIYKIIDGNGGVTLYHYDEYDELAVMVNPEGQTVKYVNNEWGKLVKQINENGEATQYVYDERQNLVMAKSPGGMQLTWEYNDQEQLIKRTRTNDGAQHFTYEGPLLRQVTEDSGRRFILEYDEQYNLARVTTPEEARYSWKYDDLGRIIQETNADGLWEEYEYDAAGNVISLRDVAGAVHTFQYDAAGNMLSAVDGQREVKFSYGPLSVLTGSSQRGANIRFNYDKELQLRSIVNEAGEMYRLELDAVGEIIRDWSFDGLHRQYIRDGAGRIRKVLRPGNRWTAFDYDSTGRLVREEHSDGTVTAYGYNKDGFITEAFNEDGAIRLQRNAAGQVTQEIQGAYTVNRTYNANGDCIFIGSNLGAAISLQHNEAGLLERMQASNGRTDLWEASWQYDHSGRELHRALTGGVTVETLRNKAGRIVRLTVGANNVEQRRTRYEWGRTGKLRSIVNMLTSTQVQFAYDEFDRLSSATYAQGRSITDTIYRIPDRVGRLFTTPEQKDRVYGKGGRLLECPVYFYHYDEEGNLIFREFKKQQNSAALDKYAYAKERKIALKGSRTGWAYEWKGSGMLQRVISPTGAETCFSYDPLGRRIASVNKRHNKITRWVWDGDVPLHEWQYNGNDYPPQLLAQANGQIQEQAEPVEDLITWVFEEDSFVPCAKLHGEERYSIITDHLGTPVQAYDGSGSKVWERELDCYGKVRKLQGDKGFCNYLYQGQHEDVDTGLVYNRFRYYDPGTGRYISQDPIGLEGGMALYNYVHDTNGWVDPFGLDGVPSAKTHAREAARRARNQFKKGQIRDLPKATSAVVNQKTGEVFTGHSGVRPDVKHPALLDAMPKDSLERWPVNNCAEVDALNKAMSRRGTKLGDLKVYTVRTDTGKLFKPCKNCKITTKHTH